MRRWSLLLGSACAAALIPSLALAADDASAENAKAAPVVSVPEVIVTARRLNAARDTIQARLGASTYTLDKQAIEDLPGGANVGLNQVVLQAPGVAQDSFGQLHIRGEHNGLQYRLNGVILPEGLSVFGQALNPHLADKVQLITGALPAEYGLRTAGIVDITTKTGFDNGGAVSLYGGGHAEIEPSVEVGGNAGRFNYFAASSYTRDDLGIESPDGRPDPLHDRTEQFQLFGYGEYIVDDASKVSLIVGSSDERFQIPNRAGQTPLIDPASVGLPAVPSQTLNENQREQTQYAIVSYLRTAGDFTGQVSLFGRYSSLIFTPDPIGDLLYDGIAQTAVKHDTAGGIQAEGAWRLGDSHTVRGGVIVEVDRSTSDTSSVVFATDAGGSPIGAPETIIDNGASTSKTYSVYLQDEWKLASNLTLNYGLRFDQFDGFRDENQVSPRVNLVWLPFPDTTVHLGYSRYFTPPPFELIASESVSKFVNTTAQAPGTLDTTPYAERSNYYDIGVSQVVIPGLSVGLDTYYKTSKHLIDEGQFGAPIIETPFNYQNGIQYGIELSTSYTRGAFSAYGNFAFSHAQGKDIVSSQFNFDPADLAYIATHYIYLDHDQKLSGSAGFSYLWDGTRFGADLLYGSGLRADGAVPNGRELSPYTQVNLAVSHRFERVAGGPLEVRLDVINALDKTYEIRDGTGVGVGAPQFGPRRGFFVGLRKEF